MEENRSLSELAALLKASYRKHASIERLFYPDRPLPIEQCYVDLALIEDKIIHDQRNTSEELRDYHLRSYERIQHSQRKLTPEQLLTECSSIPNEPKRIYIEGTAGAGKSTLSRFIAYQWANHHPAWKQYDFLFRIRLRDLTSYRYPKNIDFIEMLEKECFQLGFSDSLIKTEKENLSHYLRRKDKKILFILDGYDELSLENDAIKTLWENMVNSSYDFIITSRPGMLKTDLKTNLNVAILGFNDEQVEKYIKYFFDPQNTPDAKSEDANKCLQIFRQNPNLWSLAHTPIQLELLCNMWNDNIKDTPDITFTQLYHLLCEKLLKRCKQKQLEQEKNKKVNINNIKMKNILPKYAIYMEYLEYIAYLGMEKRTIVLSETLDNKAYEAIVPASNDSDKFYSQLEKLGFIKRDEKQTEFLHLTFQEYFAARYIARCFEVGKTPKSYKSLNEFIAKQKYQRHYEIVWWFVAGLLKDEYALLEEYFNLLQSEPNDLAEIYQFSLQLQCLAECELQLEEKSKNELFQKLIIWIQHLFLKTNTNPINENLSIPTRIIKQKSIMAILDEAIERKSKNLTHLEKTSYSSWKFNELSNLPEEISQKLVVTIKNTDKDYEEQKYAAEALGCQNSLSTTILQQLTNLLVDKSTQGFAASALSKQTALPESILQQLATLLSDKNKKVQKFAAEILSSQNQLPEFIVNDIKELFKDKSVKTFAIHALSKHIQLSEDILNELIESLGNKSLQEEIATCLSEQKSLPESTLKRLIELLKSEAGEKRRFFSIFDQGVYIVQSLVNQKNLPEDILTDLVKLLKDKKGQKNAANILANQKKLPELIIKDIEKLLEIDDACLHAAGALSPHKTLPSSTISMLATLLNRPFEKFDIAQILSYQRQLTDYTITQLANLLSPRPGGNGGTYPAAVALSKQEKLPSSIIAQLIEFLKNEHSRIFAIIALSGLTDLPNNLFGLDQSLQKEFAYKFALISKLSIRYFCDNLKKDKFNPNNVLLLRVILLKCLKQKLTFYFNNNILYVDGEAQGEFSVECRTQITQTLGQLFTEITGIPATIKNNVKQYAHNFDQTMQFQGDPTMEDITSRTTNKLRETIALNVVAIKDAISLIKDQLLQNKLNDLLVKSVEMATMLNSAALNNVVFCKQRDTHIQMLQEEVKEISTSDEFNEVYKTIALGQILPDLIFPFWFCRPFLKTESDDERAQHIAKEQRLFNEQKAIRTQSTFIQALGKLKEDRKRKESRRPKLYFMYAWPVPNYAQRESEIQTFLGNLRQDLSHAGIEAIFDREDNFSGNNLAQFMGQILQENCIVLVFGTESFRHKWFGYKTALQVEGDFLKLKWLTDFTEGSIQPNQKTTIIPLVLTGIRETAIPEDLLPAKNPTVRALYNLSYQQIVSSLLTVAYGITEQAVTKYINDTSDHIIPIDPPSHSAPTNYSAIQPQTLFGRGIHQINNSNTPPNHTIATSVSLMEIEESNTNVPK